MNKLPNHTALKEWSNVIDALGRGEQVVLIRKGGIADPKFGVEADRFYLYPTYFHQPGAPAEPQDVPIAHWCEVVKTCRVCELEAMEKLLPFVVMPWEALQARYRFRPDQALHVLGVRTMKLAQPVTIRVQPAYIGCRSWVSIDDEIDIAGSLPVMSEDALLSRLAELDQAIQS